MSATADLIIRVVADTKGAKKPLDDSASRVDKVSHSMNKLALPAAAVVAGIAAFGKAAVDSASKTQQAMGALDSVFGKNSGVVKKWAAEAATSVGLSQSQYGELATVIGAQLKNLGIPFDQIAGKTKNMITLGADLAATFGGTTAEAVSALSATMRGETDPIERYGVSIKQATIDAKMAADGTDKLTGAAAKQARTMATLALISEQTASAHGQFARETDSAAGSAQIASAQMENFKSTMGTALLPIVAAVTAALGRFASFAQKNSTLVQILVGVVFALSVAILAVVAALKVYTIVTTIAALAAEHAWIAALGPIGLVILAVIAVVAAIVILWKKSETFRRIVIGVWKAIQAVAAAVGRAILAIWRPLFAVLSVYVKAYMLVFKLAFAVIRVFALLVAAVIKAAFRVLWAVMSALLRPFITIFKAQFAAIRSVAQDVANAIGRIWAPVWAALKAGAAGVTAALVGPFNTVKSAIEAVIEAVKSLTNWLNNIKVPSIKIPHIPGVNSVLSAAVPGVGGVGLSAFAAPPVAGRSRGATAAPGGVVINIHGALDAEGVARQVGRLLDGHDRRVRGRPS